MQIARARGGDDGRGGCCSLRNNVDESRHALKINQTIAGNARPALKFVICMRQNVASVCAHKTHKINIVSCVFVAASPSISTEARGRLVAHHP